MTEPVRRIQICLLTMVLAVHCAYANNYTKTVSCEEAVKNAPRIKVGMQESEVLDLLGSPKIITDGRWSYSFDCVKFPPKVGETIITGVDIFYSDGAVKEIRLAWVDATGVPRPTKPSNRKRRSQRHE